MTDSDGPVRRTGAVLTAFLPDARLLAVVESALAQCAAVIVVDNTPAGDPTAGDLLGSRAGVTIIQSGANYGLATALNQGVRATQNFEFILFLDQDSVLDGDVVVRLEALLDADSRRGIAAPAPWDAEAGRYIDPRTSRRPEVAVMPVVITSGMLVRRQAWNDAGGMRDDFFVDCVDQDLCLQVRRAGWTIVQDKSVLLEHTLGETTWHGFGPFRVRATHHPSWRLYWIARNGLILSREFWGFDRRWVITNLAILAYWFATVLLFEPPRLHRAGVLLRGVRDGCAGHRDAGFLPSGAR